MEGGREGCTLACLLVLYSMSQIKLIYLYSSHFQKLLIKTLTNTHSTYHRSQAGFFVVLLLKNPWLNDHLDQFI